MKDVYHSYNELKKDLPELKNVTIKVIYDIDRTMDVLTTFEYKSFLERIKKQNIKIIVLPRFEGGNNEQRKNKENIRY